MSRAVFEGFDIQTCDCARQTQDAVTVGNAIHYACRNCHRTVAIRQGVDCLPDGWKPAEAFQSEAEARLVDLWLLKPALAILALAVLACLLMAFLRFHGVAQ